MRNRIGRDQIFEAMNVAQHVFAHDMVGAPRVRTADILKYFFEHFEQEGACAAGEIENSDTF